MKYSANVVAKAKKLLDELTQLRKQPASPATAKRIAQLRAAIVRVTGAPTAESARLGVAAYEKACAAQEEARKKGKVLITKARPRRSKKSVPSKLPNPITVVGGGLPGTGRR